MFSLVHTLPGYRATSDTLWLPACLQRASREQQPILFVKQQPRIGKHNFISRKPILKGSTAGLKAASRRRAGEEDWLLECIAKGELCVYGCSNLDSDPSYCRLHFSQINLLQVDTRHLCVLWPS